MSTDYGHIKAPISNNDLDFGHKGTMNNGSKSENQESTFKSVTLSSLKIEISPKKSTFYKEIKKNSEKRFQS